MDLHKLISVLTRKNNSISWRKVFLISFFLKALLFIYLNYFHTHHGLGMKKEGILIYGRDTESYMAPIESLVNKKVYAVNENASAFRMPGLLPVYLPLYAIFPRDVAHQLFIIFQLIADALIAVIIYRLLSLVDKQHYYLAFAGWLLYILSAFVSSYNHIFGSEVFAALALSGSAHYLVEFLRAFSLKKIFLSGILMCWFIFLKPVGVVFIGIIPLFLAIYCYRSSMTNKWLFWIKASLIYVSVFVVVETCWIIRNHNTFHKFIPLTNAFDAKSNSLELKKFFMATGLSFQEFSGSDHLAWFSYEKGDKFFNENFSNSDPFPKWIYTSEFNFDSLKNLRSLYWAISKSNNVQEQKSRGELFKKTISEYTASFKREHPFHSSVTVNLVFLKKLFFIKAAYNIPLTGKSVLHKVARVSYIFYYYFILLGFLLFTIMFFFSKYIRDQIIIGLLLISWTVIFSLVLVGAIENRYLVPVYPFILTLAVLFYNNLFSAIRKKMFNTRSL